MSLVCGLIGCGPPALGSPAAQDETSSSGDSEPATPSPDASSEDEDTGPAETETETGDSGLGFVPECDLICNLGCDPFAQDCPEGEKCVPYASSGGSWDDNKCVAVTGDLSEGEPCTYGGSASADDDCDGDNVCWDQQEIDGVWVGVCRSFCGGTPDDPQCEGDEDGCMITNSGTINLCLQRCDPLAQDCEGERSCYWAGADFQCLIPAPSAPVATPCHGIAGCGPGLVCLPGEVLPECEGASCCASFCDLGGGGSECEASPGSSCLPFFEEDMAPLEHQQVGVCITG